MRKEIIEQLKRTAEILDELRYLSSDSKEFQDIYYFAIEASEIAERKIENLEN